MIVNIIFNIVYLHLKQVFLHTISSIMMADKLFSDQIMAMWAIMDLSVKIKSGSDTFWTVKQMANITSNMFSFIFLTE